MLNYFLKSIDSFSFWHRCSFMLRLKNLEDPSIQRIIMHQLTLKTSRQKVWNCFINESIFIVEKLKTLWVMEKVLILSNLFFFRNILKMSSAEASKSFDFFWKGLHNHFTIYLQIEWQRSVCQCMLYPYSKTFFF